MSEAPPHPEEPQRLDILNELDLLDSAPDPGLDALVRAASMVCDTPISLVSLVSSDRQWFKAAVGLEQGAQTPREHAFCAHAVSADQLLEVTDAIEDPRFVDNPLVTDSPNIRFYAGVPIHVAGLPLGTLCVIDHKPRSLTDQQKAILETLSTAASELISVKYQELAEKRLQLSNVIEATEVAVWEYDIPSGAVLINDRWAELLGYTREQLEPVSREKFESLIHPSDINVALRALESHLSGAAKNYECEIRMKHKDGHWAWLLTRGRVLEWGEDETPLRMFGVHLDIQSRKSKDESLRRMRELLETTGRMARVGGWQLDLKTQELLWSDETKRIHGVPEDYEPALDAAINFYAPEARDPIQSAVDQSIVTGEPWDLELPLIRADGETIWVHAQGSAHLEDGQPTLLYGAFQDITERRSMLLDLSDNRELLRVTLESIGDAVVTTDETALVTWLNPIAERLTGWSSAEAVGRHLGEIFNAVNEHDRSTVPEPVSRCLEDRKIVTLANDTVLIARDGTEHAVEDSAAPIISEDGNLIGAVMVFHDVTEKRRLTGEMRYRAKHDALTHLINRTEFEHRLEALLEADDDSDVEHGVMYLDLDQFKIVNDSCGHAVGDELLQKLASLFKDTVRSRDTVARLGGDEFAIILERCPQGRALKIAEEVCERVRDFRFIHGDQRFRVGVSIGLVQMGSSWSNVSAVLQAADTACYAAKNAGRDRVHLYESSDSAIVNQRSETLWATQLEAALEHEQLVLFSQAIVPARPDRKTMEGLKLELLLRLKRDTGELVLPGAFIPVAERFHLITRIDRWVLERALKALAQGSLGDVTLFVNLSGRSIGDKMFQEFALTTLRLQEPSTRQRLVLEITETAMISNLVDARAFLEALQDMGVGVALDDFGSGMSSFGYLNALPVSYLKLDGDFVTRMRDDELAMVAIRSFIDVASVLGIPTIAEHVENQESADALTELGVDYIQGFHIGHPAPVAWD